VWLNQRSILLHLPPENVPHDYTAHTPERSVVASVEASESTEGPKFFDHLKLATTKKWRRKSKQRVKNTIRVSKKLQFLFKPTYFLYVI
jgi:hypothetical protein